MKGVSMEKKCKQCFKVQSFDNYEQSHKSRDGLTAKCVFCIEDDARTREMKYGGSRYYNVDSHTVLGLNGIDEVYV